MKRRIFKITSIVVLVIVLNVIFVEQQKYIKGLDFKTFNVKLNQKILMQNKIGYRINNRGIRNFEKVEFNNPDAYTKEVPVLNYHYFYDPSKRSCDSVLCLNVHKFEEQIKYLVDNNYKILTLEEYIRWKNGEKDLPRKSVLITIDDGAAGTGFSNGNELIPILEKYQVHAVLFLITAWFDYEDYESEYLLLQSHGYDIHRKGKCDKNRIECISHEELKEDLANSMDTLNSYDSFAYPFFDYTEDSIEVLKELGVKVAFAGGNRKSTIDDNDYIIPRYEILRYISMDEFISYLE